MHVFYLLSETPAVAKEKSEPVFKVTEREVSSVAGVLRLKLLRELLFTLVTQLVVRVAFVNATAVTARAHRTQKPWKV